MKTRLLIIIVTAIILSLGIPNAYAACDILLFGPCFDSFSMSHIPLNEKSIMEQYARNIELNFGDWEIPNRNWSTKEMQLNLPATLCTEFISDGQTHYRMAKWVDTNKISSWENHYNPLLCDKWLPPIDDGIKLKWDKELYPSDDIAQIQVIAKDMNLDPTLVDSFDIHVFSDTDHTGIQLIVTETEPDAGYFYGNVFLTTTDESSGTRLLVEDAIWADYKMNRVFSKIINESFAEDISSDELTDEQICGAGYALVNEICTPKSIWDSSDFRGLQTGETISNPEVAIILESLGAILIVLFIIIYAAKKRMKKHEN
jgi:hypothetical protein